MIGATILAAEACLRVGSGSVKIICTKETLPILAHKFPSVLKIEINNLSFLKSFLKKERKTTSVALVGPGAGKSSKTMKFTEEILKFCIIFFYCSRLDDFDEPMDGLVYGATAALGFAMAENFDYVYNAASFNSTWQEVAWVRALSTAPMHAACGAMIGFAISYYRFYNKNIIFLLIGLLIAIIFHFLFNYGFFDLIVLMQLAILFFLFKNLKKRQAIIKKVWHD